VQALLEFSSIIKQQEAQLEEKDSERNRLFCLKCMPALRTAAGMSM
jgi:hypothetical protein